MIIITQTINGFLENIDLLWAKYNIIGSAGKIRFAAVDAPQNENGILSNPILALLIVPDIPKYACEKRGEKSSINPPIAINEVEKI